MEACAASAWTLASPRGCQGCRGDSEGRETMYTIMGMSIVPLDLAMFSCVTEGTSKLGGFDKLRSINGNDNNPIGMDLYALGTIFHQLLTVGSRRIDK